MEAMALSDCRRCGARPGERHRHDCEVERCCNCGGQRVSCDCPSRLQRRRLPWTGEWPGLEQCREFGWFEKFVPGVGRVPCGEDEPGAWPDLNRLYRDARWDSRARRFVRR
jgi:hypothetical protein